MLLPSVMHSDEGRNYLYQMLVDCVSDKFKSQDELTRHRSKSTVNIHGL